MLIDYIPGKKKRKEISMNNWIVVVPFTEVGKVEARAALKKNFSNFEEEFGFRHIHLRA